MEVSKQNVIDYFYSKDGRQFTVPVYQRNYEWGKENCEELFRDVLDAQTHEPKPFHFLGTIVIYKNPETEEDSISGTKVDSYVVIDGQQRITTIYLFLKALYDLCAEKDKDFKEFLKTRIENYSNNKLVGYKKIYKLKDIDKKGDKSALYKILTTDYSHISTLSDEVKNTNIYRNYFFFLSSVQKELNKNKEHDCKFFYEGLTRLEVALINLDESDNPQVVYERINSTGVDLKISDLVRNYLLMGKNSERMETLYQYSWEPMEERLIDKNSRKNHIDDFIRNYTIFKQASNGESDIYRSFKNIVDNAPTLDEFGSTTDQKEAVLDDMNKFSRYYIFFAFDKSDEDKNYSSNLKKICKCFNALSLTTIYPLLFQLFDDRNKNIIKEDDTLEEILSFFLNYLVRRSICGVPTNTLRGFFVSFYRSAFKDAVFCGMTDEAYISYIYKFMADKKEGRDVFPSDEEVKKQLIYQLDLYNYKNGTLCKFLLEVVLNHDPYLGDSKVKTDDLEIEHIMPQELNDDWVSSLGDNYEIIHKTWLHTIGNLSFASPQYNKKLGNNRFIDKVKTYKKMQQLSELYEDVTNCTDWGPKEIENRAINLSNLLINDVFRLPDGFASLFIENTNVSDRIVELTLNDDSRKFTGKYFESISIEGNEFFLNGYMTDLLMKVCEFLYTEYPDRIKEFAQNKTPIYRKQWFCYDSYGLSNSAQLQQIFDTGIFFNVFNSNEGNADCLKKLIELFDGVDKEDIVIKCHSKTFEIK